MRILDLLLLGIHGKDSSKQAMGTTAAAETTNSPHLLVLVVISLLSCLQPTMCCPQAERVSLLDFKAGLQDPKDVLASWVGQACCEWDGVECSNGTGHVVGLYLNLNSWGLNNGLGGEISPSLLGLKHLRELDLNGNNFQGITIPTFIGSLKKLTSLSLSSSGFSGLIPYQLGNLSSLRYLDLSGNNFGGITIPTFIGSLEKLTYLYLSDSGFSGLIPYQLGNLSSLQHLHLSPNNFDHSLYMDSGRWFSNLSSLQYLNLDGVDLRKADGCLESLNSLPSLFDLDLTGAELGESFHLHLSYVNFTSLREINLFAVGMNSVPSWLFEIAGLEYLNLGSNRLQKLIPDSIGNSSDNGHIREIQVTFGKLCMLNELILSGNYYDADEFNELGETLTTGCIKDSLESLHLSDSNLTGELPDWLWGFKNLKFLYLDDNSFYGAPLPTSDQQLPPLQTLILDNNKLNGTIPETLGQISQLVELDLSNNNLEGVFSEAHFSNLTKLKMIDLSFNSLLDVGSWVPPLGLTYISFSHCKVGPAFPAWIRELRNLSFIGILHASIADVIPGWFWNFSSEITNVHLSNNEINGTLPSSLRHLINLDIIDLSNNLLEGPLPQFPSSLSALDLSNNSLSGTVNPIIDMLMPQLYYLSLSTNHINGIIPLSICNPKILVALDFSKNHLSGEIPNCWDSNIGLKVMDLANNNLSGGIPTSICSIPSFQSLHLNDNHLSGKIPLTLRNCTEMSILDIGHNMFSGTIPTWIGRTMPQLEVLRLRSNLFFGNIPPQLGHLKVLRFIDLAHNNLSGTIPHSFIDLRAIKVGTPHSLAELRYDIVSTKYVLFVNYVDKINVFMKGREEEYDKLLPFLFSIDLAGNSLTGGIPEELTTLHGLQNLNLSRNHLTGNITEKISELQWLESLDLLNNSLSGTIPSSMTAMRFLNALNLSFNKFSGKIPSGGQLDALPFPSIYIGNQGLCGFPLNRKCQYDGPSQPPHPLKIDKSNSEIVEFYLSIGLGFVVSYLSFWGTLLVQKKWRITYFRFVDDMFDLVYVALAINMARMKNKWDSL